MTSTPQPLSPPSVLLIGPAGTGKTYSLATLLRAGLHVRMVATENSAPRRVLASCAAQQIPDKNFDWKFISPNPGGWDTLKKGATIVQSMSFESISKLGGIEKSSRFITFIETLNNFTSDRTGEVFGDVAEWGDDCALVLDGVTGISQMAKQLTVGHKPNPAPGEWNIMQETTLSVIQKLTADCKCFLVVIAHIEREMSEITGMNVKTVSTLGRKLGPKLPPLFSSCIEARREGDKFLWSTMAADSDTKNGDLPLENNMVPSFEPLVSLYRAQLSNLSGAQTAQKVA